MTIGSMVKSSEATEYRVSKMGGIGHRNVAGGNVRARTGSLAYERTSYRP